ncbi:TEL2-interacting protein 1 [Dispira parvispora]|uniref:TEL2-interacting protein 1 n=1 Tax=Dispira parvispora TaxID=1520584 RepID=A0A9W8E4N9_9FUNG|nr:TEL2-interacting protein 1 [Dispira parvispora]
MDNTLQLLRATDTLYQEYTERITQFTSQFQALKQRFGPVLPVDQQLLTTATVNELLTAISRLITQYVQLLQFTTRQPSLGSHAAEGSERINSIAADIEERKLPRLLSATETFLQTIESGLLHNVCYRAMLTALVSLLCNRQRPPSQAGVNAMPAAQAPLLREQPSAGLTRATLQLVEKVYRCTGRLLELGMGPTKKPANMTPAGESAQQFILPLQQPKTMELFFLLLHQSLATLNGPDHPTLHLACASQLHYVVATVFSNRADLLINFLPGVLSCICKLLQKHVVVTGSSRFLALLVNIVRDMVVPIFEDRANQTHMEAQQLTWETLHTKAVTMDTAIDQEDPSRGDSSTKTTTSPTPTSQRPSARPKLLAKDTTWWKQALPNVNRCIKLVLPLRAHAHWRVREAVAALLTRLLVTCPLTLHDALADLLESALVLVHDDYPSVQTICQQGLQDLRVCCQQNSAVRQVVYEELVLALQRVTLDNTLSPDSSSQESPTEPNFTDHYTRATAAGALQYMRLVTGFTDLLDTEARDRVQFQVQSGCQHVIEAIPLDTSLKFTTTPGVQLVVNTMDPAGSFSQVSDKPLAQVAQSIQKSSGNAQSWVDKTVIQGYREAQNFIAALRRYTDYLVATQLAMVIELLNSLGDQLTTVATSGLTERNISGGTMGIVPLQTMYFINQCLRALVDRQTDDHERKQTLGRLYPSLVKLVGVYEKYSSYSIDKEEGQLDTLPIGVDSGTVFDTSAKGSSLAMLTDCLVFQGQGLVGQIFGSAFRPQLANTLFPLLLGLATAPPVVQEQAGLTLVELGQACGYETMGNLVVDNVDYIMHGFSQRMHLALPRPAWFFVLRQAVVMAGPLIVPLMDDVLEDLLDLLETWNDAAPITLAIWRVIEAVTQVLDGSFAPATVQKLLHTKPPTPLVEASGSDQPTDSTGSSSIPSTHCLSLKLKEIVRKSTSELSQVRYHSTDDTLDHSLNPSADISPLDNPQSPESTSPTEESEGETNEVVLSPAQNLAYKIALFTPHFLTGSVPQVRITTLSALAHTLTVTHGTPEFLALIHRVWPDAVSRLRDSEPEVVAMSAHLIRVMCHLCGDFLRRRFVDDVWPVWQQFLTDILQRHVQPTMYVHLLSSDVQSACILVLQALADVARFIPLQIPLATSLILRVLPYLASRLHPNVRASAEYVLISLVPSHADLVWLILQETCQTTKPAARSHPDQVKKVSFTTSEPIMDLATIVRQRPVPGWSPRLGSVEVARQKLLRIAV